MSIFLRKKNAEQIIVTIFATHAADGKLIAWNESQVKEFGTGEKAIFYFRYPSYKDECTIMDGSLAVIDGQVQIRPSTIGLNRFITLIEKWTLTDENGKELPITLENIENLDPVVANAVVKSLNEKLE